MTDEQLSARGINACRKPVVGSGAGNEKERSSQDL